MRLNKIYQQYEAVESPWKPFYFEQKHHWRLCGILHKPWCYSTFVNVVWVVSCCSKWFCSKFGKLYLRLHSFVTGDSDFCNCGWSKNLIYFFSSSSTTLKPITNQWHEFCLICCLPLYWLAVLSFFCIIILPRNGNFFGTANYSMHMMDMFSVPSMICHSLCQKCMSLCHTWEKDLVTWWLTVLDMATLEIVSVITLKL